MHQTAEGLTEEDAEDAGSGQDDGCGPHPRKRRTPQQLISPICVVTVPTLEYPCFTLLRFELFLLKSKYETVVKLGINEGTDLISGSLVSSSGQKARMHKRILFDLSTKKNENNVLGDA